MDSPFGGRPLTRTSDVRHVSVSPSSRSGYRSGSRSCSPSSYRSSDSGQNAATRRPSRSPTRRRTTQEEAYFAYQAARLNHRNNAILVDDSPYIPPSTRPPLLLKDTHGTNGRLEVEKRPVPVVEHHVREIHRPEDLRLAAHRGRAEEHDPGHRARESEASDTESVLSRASGAAVPARQRPPESDVQRPENKKRTREIEPEVSMPDDDTFAIPSSHPQTFNPERYPAYDKNARRVGLDHLRFVKKPKANGDDRNADHYLPRTHTYPTSAEGSTTATSEPTQSSPQPQPQLRLPQAILPPLAPDLSDDVDQLGGDDFVRGRAEGSQSGGGRRRSPRRAAPLADAADIPDSTPHVREMLGLKPDQEVTLHALADPPHGEKPTYPYPLLIQLAILGSPKKRLTLSDIYSAIEERFDWFKKTSDKAWQGSIRHTLSLKSIFRSVSRPITEPGKGNYWMVDHTQGDGNKRTRKRNPRPKKQDRLHHITLKQTATGLLRREEEEETPTDDDYDSDMPVDDSNIDPQLRGRAGYTANQAPANPTGYPFNGRHSAPNNQTRPVAVPFTPPTVTSSSPTRSRGPATSYTRSTLSSNGPGQQQKTGPPYSAPFGPAGSFGPPSFGPSQGASNNRQSYSPASSAPSPPLSTVSTNSRQSSGSYNGGANFPPPRPRQTSSGSNPFGLRHVGPTQRAWHRTAGRTDDTSSGEDSD